MTSTPESSRPGLHTERHGSSLHVVLSRPKQRNALDGPTVAALTAVLSDPGDARFVLVRGEGNTFCAGADISSLSRSGTLEEHTEESMALHRMLASAQTCPAPMVAAVNGHALGAGCALAACADIVLAEHTASFGIPEVRAGVIPAIVAPVISRRVPVGAARRLLLTGEPIDASEALRIGLADIVTGELAHAISTISRELGLCGPEALRDAKRILVWDPHPAVQARRMAEVRSGEEATEGLRALREHRHPTWAEAPES